MDGLFQKAIESYGKDYLNAEYKLREGGSSALDLLHQNSNHPDPIGRLMVDCLLSWMRGKAPEFQAALDYLDYIPKRAASTPLGAPPPLSIAYVLNERFGPKVADFLSLRLVKGKEWPRWRVVGVLLYLKDQKLPSTTSALIRFAAETQSDEARGYAIEAIRDIADPDLKAKLAFERNRQEGMHKVFPEELADLGR